MSIKSHQIKLFILIVIISITFFPLAKEISKNYILKKQLSDIQKQIDNLKKENFKLHSKIDSLQKNKTVELEAKSKLNLKKQDEEVIIIPQQDQEIETITNKNLNQQSNLIKKIINYLKLKFWK